LLLSSHSLGAALPQKSFETALPPDVRRGIASPFAEEVKWAVPLVWPLAQ